MEDYWCSRCDNYLLLEKGEDDMLKGWCALCGKTFSMSYEDFKKWEKEYFKGKKE